MQTHHTPGPWALDVTPIGWLLVSNGADITAQAFDCSDADARLIAAAPDLLAALHRAAAALASVSYSDPSIESAYSTVLAAIARAHGQ